jgi:hypothetical protein
MISVDLVQILAHYWLKPVLCFAFVLVIMQRATFSICSGKPPLPIMRDSGNRMFDVDALPFTALVTIYIA